MAKWWKSAALVALGMAALPASAQAPAWPAQAKPGMMGEPVPVGPSISSMGVQAAPSMGGGAPMGGEGPVCLPGNLPTAWDEPGYMPPCCYASIGYLGLERAKLGHGPIAFLDTASGGVDTGVTTPFRAPVFADYNDILPRLMSGVQATIGYHFDTYALEVSGFHLGQGDASRVYTAPGRIDVPFNVKGDFQNFPTGFNGNNILWLQGDLLRTNFKTSLTSGEASFKWWNGYDGEVNWSLGCRYLNIYERFGIFVGDDDLTQRDINGNPNPVTQMQYTTTVNNHIVAPQLGVEWNKPLTCKLAFTIAAKGAWGVNFVDFDTLLKRGDGLVGQDLHHTNQVFSHLYELGIFMNINLLERARLKAGFDMLWAAHIAEATDQVNFDLGATKTRRDFDGSAFYFGPSVELQVVF